MGSPLPQRGKGNFGVSPPEIFFRKFAFKILPSGATMSAKKFAFALLV